MRLAFQLPRPRRSLRPSPCLALDTRIPAPGFSSRSIITPRPYQLSTGLKPVLVKVGAPGPSLCSWPSCSPRAPAAAAVTAGPTGAGRAGAGGGPRSALPLVAALGPGVGSRPGCSVIGRAADGGASQPCWPRSAELRELAGLSLLRAALLAPISAGGLRFPVAVPRRPRQRQELARGSVASAALGKAGTTQGFGERGRESCQPSLDSESWPASGRVRCGRSISRLKSTRLGAGRAGGAAGIGL